MVSTELAARRLELLREIVPLAKRVAVLYKAADPAQSANSSRSTVVSPPDRPRLRSARARATHARNAEAVRSRSLATRPTVWPSSNTRRTAPALNSSVKVPPCPSTLLAWFHARHRIRLPESVHASGSSPERAGTRCAALEMALNFITRFAPPPRQPARSPCYRDWQKVSPTRVTSIGLERLGILL